MNKFKQLRIQNGLTQSELAARLGVTRGAVSNWENGVTFPNTRLIPLLKQVLSCTSDDILPTI